MPLLSFRSSTDWGDNTAGVSSVNAPAPSGTTYGDGQLIALVVAVFAPASPPDILTPAGWTAAGTSSVFPFIGAALNAKLQVFRRIAEDNEGTAVLATTGAVNAIIAGVRVSDSSPNRSDFLGTPVFAAGAASTTATVGPVVMQLPRSVLGIFVVQGVAQSITPPGSMTERNDNATLAVSYADEQIDAAGSTGTRAFTLPSSSEYLSVALELRSEGDSGQRVRGGPGRGPHFQRFGQRVNVVSQQTTEVVAAATGEAQAASQTAVGVALGGAGEAQATGQAQGGAVVAGSVAAQEPSQAGAGVTVTAAGAGQEPSQQVGAVLIGAGGVAQAAAQASGGATAGVAAAGGAQAPGQASASSGTSAAGGAHQPGQAQAKAGVAGVAAAQATGQASSLAAVSGAGSAQDASQTSSGLTVRALAVSQAAAQAAGATGGAGIATAGEAETVGQASAAAAAAAAASAQEPGQASASIAVAAAGVSTVAGQASGVAAIASVGVAQAPGQAVGAQPLTVTAFGASTSMGQATGAVGSADPAPAAPAESQGSMGRIRTRHRSKAVPLKPLDDKPTLQLDLPLIQAVAEPSVLPARNGADQAAHRAVVEALCRAAELLLEADE